jgi:hypothetical protein
LLHLLTKVIYRAHCLIQVTEGCLTPKLERLVSLKLLLRRDARVLVDRGHEVNFAKGPSTFKLIDCLWVENKSESRSLVKRPQLVKVRLRPSLQWLRHWRCLLSDLLDTFLCLFLAILDVIFQSLGLFLCLNLLLLLLKCFLSLI